MLCRLRSLLPLAMLTLIPLVLVGWTLTAVLAESTPTPSATPSAASGATSETGGDIAHGQQLFGSGSDCTSCHGANLEGGVGPKLNPIAPLQGVKDPLNGAFLFATIKNGRPASDGFATAMPAHSSLSDQSIRDIVAFIIHENQSGSSGLSPVDLARSNVLWITVTIGLLVLVTWLLSRYNMRWIARRAAAGRDRKAR
ncbi:MAG: c-type cytochrome [Candidatus Dormibacteraceae bacterium]